MRHRPRRAFIGWRCSRSSATAARNAAASSAPASAMAARRCSSARSEAPRPSMRREKRPRCWARNARGAATRSRPARRGCGSIRVHRDDKRRSRACRARGRCNCCRRRRPTTRRRGGARRGLESWPGRAPPRSTARREAREQRGVSQRRRRRRRIRGRRAGSPPGRFRAANRRTRGFQARRGFTRSPTAGPRFMRWPRGGDARQERRHRLAPIADAAAEPGLRAPERGAARGSSGDRRRCPRAAS